MGRRFDIYEQKLTVFSHLEYETSKTERAFFVKKIGASLINRFYVDGEFAEFTFFFNGYRKDQDELFRCIYSECPFPKSIIELKRKRGFSFRALFSYVFGFGKRSEIKKTILKYYPGYKIGLKERLYIQSEHLMQRAFSRKAAKKDFPGLKYLVVLADGMPFEQSLTVLLKSRGFGAITAQHGVFYEQENFSLVQKLNYFRSPSDYLLAWGSATEELFKKHSPGVRTFICGNPLTERSSFVEENYIAVAGDTPSNRKQNAEMIRIAENYARNNGLGLVIRLHPADSEKEYSVDGNVSVFRKDTDGAKFIILHTSSMVFRFMAAGKKVLCYRSEIVWPLVPDEIKFSGEEELAALAGNIKNIDFEGIFKSNIAYLGDESKEKYRQAFKTIREGETDG